MINVIKPGARGSLMPTQCEVCGTRIHVAVGAPRRCDKHETTYKVVEGVESTWHYHIAPLGSLHTSLCGRMTMPTGIPLSGYGFTPKDYHIPVRWCQTCRQLLENEEAT
jgi:hypothetical protein